MTKNMLLAGAAVTGVLGYALGVGLARVTAYATRVEEDEYCRPPAARPGRRRPAAHAA